MSRVRITPPRPPRRASTGREPALTRTTATVTALLVGCGGSGKEPCATPEHVGTLAAGNVVVVLMDDVGVDKVGAYAVHPRPAPTPNIDALAATGARFTSAFAEPVCSPSRAALLTGRRPIHTGIGMTVSPNRGSWELSDDERLIPAVLAEHASQPWSSAAIGKWHLSLFDDHGLDAPRRQGFDHFDGLLGNPGTAVEKDDEGPYGYYRWEHIVDGAVGTSETYLLDAQGDAAVDAIRTLPEPFFVYVAFSAAHLPLQVPPEGSFEQADPVDDLGVGDAMIEAMDRQVGRIAEALGDRGVLLLTADNGTSKILARPPLSPARAKGSVYPGGTRVPLVVAGPGIEPAVHDGLAHVTDLFHTVLDLAGVDTAAVDQHTDGTSLLPLLTGGTTSRRCLFVEQFGPNGDPPKHVDTAVIDDGFALVAHPKAPLELYRRTPAVVDGPDLLLEPLEPDADEAYQRLRRQLRHGE